MAIALVAGQTASAFNPGGTTQAVVLTNNPARGSLVVVGVVHGNTALTATVADSNGNVYTPTPLSPVTLSTLARVYNFYLKDAPPNASKTITVTISGSTDITAHAAEFSGADAFSVVDTEGLHNDGTSSTNINDPTLLPNANGDLLYCTCAGNISSANSPWTGVASIVNGNYAEYLIQGTRASQAVAFTQTISVWGAVATAFRAATTAVVQPGRQTDDDESGWLSEMTQIKEWWGAGISLKGWYDIDFESTITASTQNITGVKYSNAQTFGASKLSFGLTGAKYVNNQSFGAATVARGPVTVTGVKFTNTQSFKVAVVTRGPVTVGGVKFTNTQTFGAASVANVSSVLGVKFTNAQSFKNAVITTVFNMAGVKFTNLQSFKVAVVSATYSISGVKFTNNQTFGAAVVTRGAVTIQGSKFTNAQTFATATVAALLQNVTGARFVNSQSFFNASITQPGAGGTTPNDWMRHTRRLRR